MKKHGMQTGTSRANLGVRLAGSALLGIGVLAMTSAAAAEDHVSCYRVRDEGRRAAAVMELTNQLGTESCRVRRSAFLCLPSTADGSAPDPSATRVCYRATCTGSDPPRTLGVRDAMHTEERDVGLSNGRSRLVCLTAESFTPECGNGVIDAGEECDPVGDDTACPGACAADCTCPAVAECNGLPATIVGTRRADTIQGTDGDDVIQALGGSDLVFGHGGNDVICGGAGNDTLHGGTDNDQLFGGAGGDIIFGGPGTDELLGERGDDTLHGGTEADVLNGGPGADMLFGNEGDDVLEGEVGPDTLHGGADFDRLFGGPGDDYLASTGGDECDAGQGTDTCVLCASHPSCEIMQ